MSVPARSVPAGSVPAPRVPVLAAHADAAAASSARARSAPPPCRPRRPPAARRRAAVGRSAWPHGPSAVPSGVLGADVRDPDGDRGRARVRVGARRGDRVQRRPHQARIARLIEDGEGLRRDVAEMSAPSRVAHWAKRKGLGDPGDPRRRAAGSRRPRRGRPRVRRMRRTPAHRLLTLFCLLLFALAAVVVRLGVLQVRQAGAYVALGWDQRVRTVTLAADRGEIVDRNGAPLALSLEASDMYADPRYVTDPAAEAATIATVLGWGPPRSGSSAGVLREDGSFVYVARRSTGSSRTPSRPRSSRGSGSSRRRSGTTRRGASVPRSWGSPASTAWGSRGSRSSTRRCSRARRASARRSCRRSGSSSRAGSTSSSQPVEGDDLVLTIDREIQFQAEQYLRRAVQENRAAGGTIIVMDPRTGDIYAMASYPWFDPTGSETSIRRRSGTVR